jgi:hypothetical protein
MLNVIGRVLCFQHDARLGKIVFVLAGSEGVGNRAFLVASSSKDIPRSG